MKEAPWDFHIEACGYEPAPSRVFGSAGAAGRQGMAELGAAALHLPSTPAHLTCLCSHLILPLLLSPRPAWWEADRHLTVPFPGWGMMLSSFPQALVWEEEVGWEAGDGGRWQHAREEKDAGTADLWLAAKKEGWESTPIQRHQPRRKGAE